LPTAQGFVWLNIDSQTVRLYLETFGLLAICATLAGGIVYRGHRMKTIAFKEPSHYERRIDTQLLPPLLIPSRTDHSRAFPKKHSFSYSYLFVGVPIGLSGTISKALSVDSVRRSWFHVDCADYLARGNAQLGLAEKLKRYLHTQGVTDRDYAFAYLITAPRFLRYHFNPVSFWYLYDSDASLKYMILEVNNTFDERRMYLLRGDTITNGVPQNGDGRSVNGHADHARELVFREEWEKDFHVSPFNSRKGSYSLRAIDPFAEYERNGRIRFDNTIVLCSSKEHAKIVARVKSDGEPMVATEISYAALYRFIGAWWWVGLVTFPRIVWQAQKLYFRRNLHVWFRPEVTEDSIGRTYTTDERVLETYFRGFLQHSVEQSKHALRVEYRPAHAIDDGSTMYSPNFTFKEDRESISTLEVLSPAFYSRFVHYAHTKEAFDRECLTTDVKNRTISIGNAHLLSHILGQGGPDKNGSRGFIESLRWNVLKRLRCPPAESSYPHNVAVDPSYQVTDIRSIRDSDLDRFVRYHCTDPDLYRTIATRLFLAQRYFLGIPILVSAMDVALRIAFTLIAIHLCYLWRDVDIVRPRSLGRKDLSSEDIPTFATLLLLANFCHIWAMIKG